MLHWTKQHLDANLAMAKMACERNVVNLDNFYLPCATLLHVVWGRHHMVCKVCLKIIGVFDFLLLLASQRPHKITVRATQFGEDSILNL